MSYICPDGLTLSGTKCIGASICEEGTEYDETLKKCKSRPVCDLGYYLPTEKRCGFMVDCKNGGYVDYSIGGRCVSDTRNCPTGTTLDPGSGKCIKNGTCASGFTYNATTSKCEKAPVCPSGTTFDASVNKCVKVAPTNKVCSSGFTYNATTNKCEKAPTCPSGTTFDASTGKCVKNSTCSTGFTYNSATAKCEKAPTCVTGYTFNTSIGKCTQVIQCPPGFTSKDDTTCFYASKCQPGYTKSGLDCVKNKSCQGDTVLVNNECTRSADGNPPAGMMCPPDKPYFQLSNSKCYPTRTINPTTGNLSYSGTSGVLVPAPPPPPPLPPPNTVLRVGPINQNRRSADPCVVYKNGYFYALFTADGVQINQSQENGVTNGLFNRARVQTLKFPYELQTELGLSTIRDTWAPELFYNEDNKTWYIFGSCSDHPDNDSRSFIYYITNSSGNPDLTIRENWTAAKKVTNRDTDGWCIDPVVGKIGSKYYMVYSYRRNYPGDPQSLVIREITFPSCTFNGAGVIISSPQYGWERQGRVDVNEGPEFLRGDDGKIFIVYSASFSQSADYCLGLLQFMGGDPLNPSNWNKFSNPVFKKSNVVFGPGHNSMAKVGDQWWNFFHATNKPDQQWGFRVAMAQTFYFDTNGIPQFGSPDTLDAGASLVV